MFRIIVAIVLVQPQFADAEMPSFREFKKTVRELTKDAIYDGTPDQILARHYSPDKNLLKFYIDAEEYADWELAQMITWEDCAASANTRMDVIWPRFVIEDKVLRYELGCLNAFQLRAPRPTDDAIRAQFMIELYYRCNEASWREPKFWFPVLREAETFSRKLYESAVGRLELSAEEIEMAKDDLEAVILDAVIEKAKSYGIEKTEPLDAFPIRKIKFVPAPRFEKSMQRLWGIKQASLELADHVDVRMSTLCNNWHELEWFPVPKKPVPAVGSYFGRAKIDPSSVPLYYKDLASNDKVLREKAFLAKRITLMPNGSTPQYHYRKMLTPEEYYGRHFNFSYGVFTRSYERFKATNYVEIQW